MRKYLGLLTMAFLSLFIACESDDSSDLDSSISFYQNLQVVYNVTQNETHVAANFNENSSKGKNVTLSGKSSILFNGENPDYLNVEPYFYTYNFPRLDAIDFKFTREKGKVYINRVSLEDAVPVSIPTDFTTINKEGTTTFTWEGVALGKEEKLQVLVESDSIGTAYFYVDQEGATSIDINFDTVVATGSALFSVSRTKVLPLQQSEGVAGGEIQVVYTVSKEIRIE